MKRQGLLYGMMLSVLICASAVMAYAAEEYEPLEVRIPYRHEYITTDEEVDSKFYYEIKGEEGAPLPLEADEEGRFAIEGTTSRGEREDGRTRYEVTGSLTLRYTKPGEYVYELASDAAGNAGKSHAERYSFEERRQRIRVYIGNGENGSLRLEMLTVESSEGVKPNELTLETGYEWERAEEPQTGDRTPLTLYGVALAGAVGLMIVLVKYGGKKQQSEDGSHEEK